MKCDVTETELELGVFVCIWSRQRHANQWKKKVFDSLLVLGFDFGDVMTLKGDCLFI